MRGQRGSAAPAACGVRRPLRFLAWKLELDDEQLGEVAKILAELKTERAQGEVDRAKRLAALADAVSAEAFDASRAAEGAALARRERGAHAQRDVKALERLHALLDARSAQDARVPDPHGRDFVLTDGVTDGRAMAGSAFGSSRPTSHSES